MGTVESELDIEHEDGTAGDMTPPGRRAPRISQADVFQVADALLVEGHRPTIDRVRMRLGRGSPNTINDHLDTWWAKLGSRLRDLPGQEFPRLPERVAHALQQLWNEALDGAQAALRDTLSQREQTLAQQERGLQARERELTDRERTATARAAALEESVTLAREQLAAANRRATGLERSLQEREGECARLRARIESLETNVSEGRVKLDAASAAHHTERFQLQERYTAAESRWMVEVDRARQHTREAAKEYEHKSKELRRRVEALQSERDQLRQDLLEVRADCKTMTAVREQLEERLRSGSQATHSVPSAVAAKVRGSTKRARQPATRARHSRARDAGTAK